MRELVFKFIDTINNDSELRKSYQLNVIRDERTGTLTVVNELVLLNNTFDSFPYGVVTGDSYGELFRQLCITVFE